MKFKPLSLCLILTLISFVLPIEAEAQLIDVGNEKVLSGWRDTIYPEYMEVLKESTTYFVYRDSDEEHLETLEQNIDSFWTISDLEMISYDEFLENYGEDEVLYSDESYSFFVIEGYTGSDLGDLNSSLYLTLNINVDNKRVSMAQFDLGIDLTTEVVGKKHSAKSGDFHRFLYTSSDATFENWNILYLTNIIRNINDKLQSNEPTSSWMSLEYQKQIKNLQNDTLFVPDFVLKRYDLFKDGHLKGVVEPKDIFKKYRYPLEVLPMEDIVEEALDRTKSLYYMSYFHNGVSSYLVVINYQTGQILYLHDKDQYHLKKSRIAKLSKLIKKGG